jgi:H+-transporting ATPase
VLEFAYIANYNAEGPIKEAISKEVKETGANITNYKITDFTPYDSDRKRSTAKAEFLGGVKTIAIGAPQVILKICGFGNKQFETEIKEIEGYAQKGYKSLVVAVKNGNRERNMTLAGVILFSDVLRTDSKEVLDFLVTQGINTKLITGDSFAISRRIAEELELKGKVLGKQQIAAMDFKTLKLKDFNDTAVFSEILPIEKFQIVEFAKKHYVVAVTGDGVNDIPPVETSDVGIAVKQAVDALKGAADIVILEDGISVIKDTVIEARKIFSRLYSYAVYRISESFRVIFNILVIGLLYRNFPLLPIQLIILTLLNDIPIVSLAFNRVEAPRKPAKATSKKKFYLGTALGMVGLVNSLIFFFLAKDIFGASWGAIQTMFFLKLSVSGHMLIFVAHTKKRWYKFLPSKTVIISTLATQLVATGLVYFGILMQSISWEMILIVWIWGLFWMQISEIIKVAEQFFEKKFLKD